MKMKRAWLMMLSLILVLTALPMGGVVMSVSAAGSDPAAELPADTELVILYTGDVHGAIDSYPVLAGYREHLIELGYEVITVDVGDAVQGEYVVNRDEGATAIELMNAVGYDYAVPGNHEFDFGVARFLTMAQSEANFTYLSANFEDMRNLRPVLPTYETNRIGDKCVAFVGITTPETFTSSSGDTFKDESGNYVYTFASTYDYQDFITPIQTAVDQARDAGADIVVALGHVGISEVKEGWRASDVIAATSGIDVFLDAHSHSVTEQATYQSKDGKDVLLTASGSKLAYFGQIAIKSDGSAVSTLIDPASIDVSAFSATAKERYDAVKTKVEKVNEEVSYLFEPIGTSEVDLLAKNADGAWLVRGQETNLANLVADAYLYGAPDADFALVNAGGIRENIKAGDVSRMDIMNVNPWSNEMVTVKIRGWMLLDALEFGASKMPEDNAGLLHTSSTLTYTVHTWRESPVVLDSMGLFLGINEAMPRRVSDVKLNGQAIEPMASYTVVGSKFILLECGDGYSMFSGATDATELAKRDSELLLDYFENGLGGVITAEAYGTVDGRFRTVAEEPIEPNPDDTDNDTGNGNSTDSDSPARSNGGDDEENADFNVLWIVLPVAGAVAIGAAIAVPMLLRRRRGTHG